LRNVKWITEVVLLPAVKAIELKRTSNFFILNRSIIPIEHHFSVVRTAGKALINVCFESSFAKAIFFYAQCLLKLNFSFGSTVGDVVSVGNSFAINKYLITSTFVSKSKSARTKLFALWR
jgi:hypothetical protein